MRDNCEERAMADYEDIRQPQMVSKSVANYLDMTTPRSRMSKQRLRRREERKEQGRTTRPPIDNRGLSLEEGNDFA
jgi:hypothetical protein